MRVRPFAVAAAILLCAPTAAWAANAVAISSLSVGENETNVSIDIRVDNDVAINALVMPLEIRSLDPGAFPAGNLTLTVQGRVAASGLKDLYNLVKYPSPAANSCSGPVTNTYGTAGTLDYISPDALMWTGLVVTSPCFAPGTDDIIPSFVLTFDVNAGPGSFIVDTACVLPANHLMMVDCQTFGSVPIVFTPGIVTIQACSCPCYGDPLCDGVTDGADLTRAIAQAFEGEPSVPDPFCPDLRADVQRNGAVDILDVISFSDVAFEGADASVFDPPTCPGGPITVPESCTPGLATGNEVWIESKTVATAATDVEVGIYIQNIVPLTGLVLPLELRSITEGSFTTQSLTFTAQGRVAASGLHDFGTGGARYFASAAQTSCSGPFANTYQAAPVAGAHDFASPDGVFWSGAEFNGVLTPGSDGTPESGVPSFLFRFDVNGNDGTFIIDTCCVTPGNHLLFIEKTTLNCVIPAFTPGIITIGLPQICNERPEDINCDGLINVLDVVQAINVALRGSPESDPCCRDSL